MFSLKVNSIGRKKPNWCQEKRWRARTCPGIWQAWRERNFYIGVEKNPQSSSVVDQEAQSWVICILNFRKRSVPRLSWLWRNIPYPGLVFFSLYNKGNELYSSKAERIKEITENLKVLGTHLEALWKASILLLPAMQVWSWPTSFILSPNMNGTASMRQVLNQNPRIEQEDTKAPVLLRGSLEQWVSTGCDFWSRGGIWQCQRTFLTVMTAGE